LTSALEESRIGRTEIAISQLFDTLELGVQQMEYRIYIDFNVSANELVNMNSPQFASVSNMILTMLYSNRETISNVNLIMPDETDPYSIRGYFLWQYTGTEYTRASYAEGEGYNVTQYSTKEIDKFFTTRQKPVASIDRQIAETSIKNTDFSYYYQILQDNSTSGIVTTASYLSFVHQITSGVGTKIEDEHGRVLFTIVAFFYAGNVMKQRMIATNPSKNGFIAIFQDDGVLIADSFEGSRVGNVTLICDSDEPQILELCRKIIADGGFENPDLTIPDYKTKHPRQKPAEIFAVTISTIKRSGGRQLRLFVVLDESDFHMATRNSIIISAGIAIGVVIVAIVAIIAVVNPISKKISALSKG
jgi:uncharacterized membrane protein YciS (DUF1049 family)